MAFTHSGTGYSNIYVMNADGSGVKALTNDMADNMHFTSFDSDPSWSPDGTKIAFERLNNGVRSVFVMNSDGTGVEPLAGVTTSNFDPRWSPDGTKIVFAAGKANGGIYVENLDGSGLTKLASGGQKPDWSPDGTRIVFSANGTIFITNSDGSSGFETLPSFGGGFPRWSPDGTKILFSKGDGLYVVDLEAGRSNLTKIYDESPSTFVGGPDWQRLLGVQSTLTVKSQDTGGNPITGYWIVLYDSDGDVLKTGFTPATFTLNSGQQYKIGMGDYGSYSFDHWLDNNSAQNPRNISVNSSDTQLTAVYENTDAFPIIHM
jgi:Tol biopolymer transport system component